MTLPPNDPQRRDDAVPPAGAAGRGGSAEAAHAAGGASGGQGASGATRAHLGAHRAAPTGAPAPRLGRVTWLLIGGGVVVVAVIVGLFFVGLRVGGAGEAAPVGPVTAALSTPPTSATDARASATPTAAASATTGSPAEGADAAAPPGPLAPGVHDWNALHGGECLSGYTSPWELQFTVVDCAGDHNAQLVSKGAFPEDAAAPYPGEAELVSRLNLLCTSPTVLDYAAAGAVPDIQWQGAYPANDAQWVGGDRSYFCFFSRTSGEPLGPSLAPAPGG